MKSLRYGLGIGSPGVALAAARPSREAGLEVAAAGAGGRRGGSSQRRRRRRGGAGGGRARSRQRRAAAAARPAERRLMSSGGGGSIVQLARRPARHHRHPLSFGDRSSREVRARGIATASAAAWPTAHTTGRGRTRAFWSERRRQATAAVTPRRRIVRTARARRAADRPRPRATAAAAARAGPHRAPRRKRRRTTTTRAVRAKCRHWSRPRGDSRTAGQCARIVRCRLRPSTTAVPRPLRTTPIRWDLRLSPTTTATTIRMDSAWATASTPDSAWAPYLRRSVRRSLWWRRLTHGGLHDVLRPRRTGQPEAEGQAALREGLRRRLLRRHGRRVRRRRSRSSRSTPAGTRSR